MADEITTLLPPIDLGAIQDHRKQQDAHDAIGDALHIIYRQLNAMLLSLTQFKGGVGILSGTGGFVTDNAIARWDGTLGMTLQGSQPLVEDDGRISTLTDPSGAQDAATKAYVDAEVAIVAAAAAAAAASAASAATDATVLAWMGL